MRDSYTPDDQRFIDWLAGKPIVYPANPQWSAIVRDHVGRGISFRRARVVSEPLSDYIRFEHELTATVNVAAGEQVRWLPRRRASDLCLPGNDLWIFDNRLIRFSHFAGNGEFLDDELCDDLAVVKTCAKAFEAIWDRAIPHSEYRPA